ncbi:unnamed protein product [Litomosoides sigmodontis]|uniref:EGF-like domain-containing protein n=1 Tax=Litomosoides sigmodontis TaxID=42156 RepID=A0A3P6UMD6_LITSI|nr:unnamed protein product [Litomosoides sigmodontis]
MSRGAAACVVRAVVFLLLVPNVLTFNERNSNEMHCDFLNEQRIVQKCFAPFIEKVNFGQFLFEKPFIAAPPTLCNLYDEYESCSREDEVNCRFQNIKHSVRTLFYRDMLQQFPKAISPANHMLHQEVIIEYEQNEIKDRKCRVVQHYLNCSLTDEYNEACPVASQIIQRYYELLLNSNESSCNLRKLRSNLPQLNFTHSEINKSSDVEWNLKNEISAGRCDIASERYVLEEGLKLREYENIGYQLFRTPFNELVKRTPCLAYKIYKRNVQGISVRCRYMNTHLERIYDYYCSDQFAKLTLNEESCIEKLQLIYNRSECSDVTHFSNAYNYSSLSKRNRILNQERSNELSGRCEFAKWYFDCGITESFYDTCPRVTENVQNYFEILINANGSNCSWRRRTVGRKETVSGKSADYFAIQLCNNCTITNCSKGFYYDERLKKCIGVDECASSKHFCSQKCINKPGGYECECFRPLYKLSRNGRRCFRIDNESVSLFLAHSHSVWNITYDAKFQLKLMPSYGDEKVAMFDYDFKEKKLYYVDLTRNSIQYVNIFDRNKVHVIQNHEVEGTEGIAVDWIHRNLYSLRQKRLHLQRLDGLYRASLYDGLFQLPRALVAYPFTRELYASDWGTKPFIVRLAMDGSEAKKIITEDLIWPNALAIDYVARRLYWADAFRDVIEAADLDGRSRRIIISDGKLVPHVFGLAVFDDMIFWSDWNRRGVLFADKLTGQNVKTLLRTVLPPYSLKAYHSAMQMGAPNLCKAAKCQHVCVPKLDGSGPQCLCAEGFIMHENGLCEPNCTKHQLLCSRPDHKCLNLIYRCDGLYNCGNGDDEMECPPPICKHDERMFPCRDNRKCILRSQRCDGFVDCSDESDELYCADLALHWSH